MSGTSRSETICLVGIILVAAALRFWYASVLPGTGRDLLHSDMGLYDKAAWQMAQGLPVEGEPGFNGYHPLSASTYIYAGYIYFLTAIYAVAGHSPLAVRLVQAFIGTVSVWLVYVVGAKIFGRRPGLIAALLAALHLPLVYYAGFLLSETWFLFLELSVLAVWLAAWGPSESIAQLSSPPEGRLAASGIVIDTLPPSRTSLVLAAIAGLLAGAACISRAAFLPAIAFLAVAALCWPLRPVTWRRRVALVSTFVVASMAAIAPVTLRNYQIHHRLILVSTNGPSTFFVGHILHTGFIPKEHSLSNDVTMANLHRHVNWEFLKRHWPKYLAEIPDFFSDMWFSNEFWPQTTTYWKYEQIVGTQSSRIRGAWDEAGGPAIGRIDFFPDLMRYVDRVLWLLIGLPLGLWAMFFLPRQDRRWMVLYAALAPYLMIPFLAPGFPRYRIPAVPLFFIFAGQTIYVCLSRRKLWRDWAGHQEKRPS